MGIVELSHRSRGDNRSGIVIARRIDRQAANGFLKLMQLGVRHSTLIAEDDLPQIIQITGRSRSSLLRGERRSAQAVNYLATTDRKKNGRDQ